jgi:hypothetical protein
VLLQVVLSSGERTTIGGLRIGDEVEGGGRVYVEHSHPEAMSTVVLSGGGASIELTGGHMVSIAGEGMGERMVPAASVRCVSFAPYMDRYANTCASS